MNVDIVMWDWRLPVDLGTDTSTIQSRLGLGLGLCLISFERVFIFI